MTIYRNIGHLYTPMGFAMVKGENMKNILTIAKAAIVVRNDGTIEYAGAESEAPAAETSVDCQGLVALPGFVDSHTHAVFYGDRSLEFTMRAEGRSYQEIAEMGGGIRSSVESVRARSVEEIVAYSRPFVERALQLGTTTMEVKSGYGLSTEAERMLLQAAIEIRASTKMEIVSTFLGAHAVPKGLTQEGYVTSIIQDQLPALSGLAEFCDVFMDEGYFSAAETIRISHAANTYGLKIKLHADELAETNGATTAVLLDAFSADHLLKVSEEGIRILASSKRTIATLLPITALSLRAPYAPARRLIDAGCAVAVATDCNPGSAMSENMQFVVTLAVIGMQMTPAEALTAATLNGAAALDRAATHGSIERNKVADFVLYDIPRLEYLPYHIAVSDVCRVVKRGEIVYSRPE